MAIKNKCNDDWIGNLGKNLKSDSNRRKRENDSFWKNIVDGKISLACRHGFYVHVEKPTIERHIICRLTTKKCVCTSHSYNSDGPMFNSDWENCPGGLLGKDIE